MRCNQALENRYFRSLRDTDKFQVTNSYRIQPDSEIKRSSRI
jgi:hypothetical protein